MTPIKVEIVSTPGGGYQLHRGGRPYVINGAGMGLDDIEYFASRGGNSIRTWTTDGREQDTRALLDSAQKNGVTVALCLTMQAERWGFDYDDQQAVARQLDHFRGEVLKYRDHPALLFWIIGNELNHGYSNGRVYDAVNDVAKMIDELDPNHPTTTTIAGMGTDVVTDVQRRAPDLDFLSIQMYGSLFALPSYLEDSNYRGPLMVTEWGAIGYWEVDKTEWGAPIEATSSEKAMTFLRGQQNILDKVGPQLLGSYAFLWGQKQERTPTWFGMFTEEGEATEVVDVMEFLWTGAWPETRAPQLKSLQLNGRSARSSVTVHYGDNIEAAVDAVDPDGDTLAFRWELKEESSATQSGGDFEEGIANLEGYIAEPSSASTLVKTPEPGTYRLFVYATDEHGHAAHANVPFRVIPRLRP